ncbi:MAG: hypothetical protein ACYCUX_12630, partial [Metallibacterium sp.]
MPTGTLPDHSPDDATIQHCWVALRQWFDTAPTRPCAKRIRAPEKARLAPGFLVVRTGAELLPHLPRVLDLELDATVL